MNREELVWAAGFFDGEGCFTHTKNGAYPIVRIDQVDRFVLDRFCAAIGFGKVSGPYGNRSRTPNSKLQFYYEARGFEKAQAIGAMLWKFLSPVKRAQFALRMSTASGPPKKGVSIRIDYYRMWYKKNKERCQEHARSYYKEHRLKILSRAKDARKAARLEKPESQPSTMDL